MARRKMPFQTVSWAATNVSTTPRMGPTHGVHPKAKANPMTNAPQADELPLRLWSRVSASSALICRIPVKWRPKRMMTAPAMRASSDLYCARTWPTSVEIAPSVMKPILKPMKKAAELSITLRKSSPSFSFNCSTPTPEIRETYPGTSGSTHGDRNALAFSWTRGFAMGAFNVFIMDVASRHYTQLTHGEGRNENPSWAPYGKHIAFMSTRSGRSQIWSMLADGTQLQQLTTQGSNLSPVWGN